MHCKATTMTQDKEVWLRGEIIEGIVPMLQPVAHALLQAGEELERIMAAFPDELLWNKPANCASPGFHLLHIAGVQDRLITYAESKQLSEDQLQNLQAEKSEHPVSAEQLLHKCKMQINVTLNRLKQFTTESLTAHRNVGRAALPSTVLGLCTHAAEHTMRHVGQLLVTVKFLKSLQ